MAAEDDRTTADDIALAYRLVLNREPDPGGLRHYTALASEGLSFRALVDALLRSTEYRERTASDDPAPIVREGSIEPGAILARFTVEEFAETADAYYRSVTDPTPLMVRPFAYLHEAPVMLQSLGMLLAGLQLGKTMRV